VDLAKMVFKQCKQNPKQMLYQASDEIAYRLLKIQGVFDEKEKDLEEGQQF
jgi:hypothetical protein